MAYPFNSEAAWFTLKALSKAKGVNDGAIKKAVSLGVEMKVIRTIRLKRKNMVCITSLARAHCADFRFSMKRVVQ